MKSLFHKDAVFVALLFVVVLLPFAQVKVSLYCLPLYLPEIALLGACALFLCRPGVFQLGRGWWRSFPRDSLFLTGLGLFVLGATLSFLTNPFSFGGLGMLKSWFFFPFLFAWLLFQESQEGNRQKTVLFLWWATLSVTAASSLLFSFFGVLTYDGRLSGLYPSPNFLALFVAPGISLSLYGWFFIADHDRYALGKRLGLLVGSGSILTTLFLTHSYAVWVATGVAVALFFFPGTRLVRGKRAALLSLVFVSLVVSFFLLEQGSAKWQALASLDSRSSLASRMMIWQAGVKILEDHPVFGIGVGRFQAVYLAYQPQFPPYLEWAVPEPHNFYLAILLSTGIVGFVGFALFVVRFLFLCGRALSLSRSMIGPAPPLVLPLLAIVVLFLVYGLVDTPYFKNDLAYSFLMPFALVWGRQKGEEVG